MKVETNKSDHRSFTRLSKLFPSQEIVSLPQWHWKKLYIVRTCDVKVERMIPKMARSVRDLFTLPYGKCFPLVFD